MKTLILAFLLGLASTIAHAECTEYMRAFNQHQLVIKGMMDMNFQGKMNAETGDAIGERLQEAQGLMDQGKYQESCNIYDSVINEYGFDKSFGEAQEQKKDDESSGAEPSSSAADAASAASSDSKTND